METKGQSPAFLLDINAKRNFIEFYTQLGLKPQTTIRFFDHVDYYTVHGDDCELIAKIIYKSTTCIHNLLNKEETPITYITLSRKNFERAIRELLLVCNLRVEVYQKRSGENNWHIEYRGSPGNLLQFEDVLFSNNDIFVGNIILSLKLCSDNQSDISSNQRKIGIASVDQNECLFQLFEFLDDDFFTELEAIIVLLSPKECLLPSMENDYAAVKSILDRNSVMTTVNKKIFAGSNEILNDLNRLLRFEKGQRPDASVMAEIRLTTAVTALQAAIKYLNLTVEKSSLGQFEMKPFDLQRFVFLDNAAVSALNILPKSGAPVSSRRWDSLLSVLDHCHTPQGHRLMAQWVKQPLRSLEIINDRHDVVECLLNNPNALDSIHSDYLKRIPDILTLANKIMRRKATLSDLFRIYQVIKRTPTIYNALLNLGNSTVKSMLCDPLKSCLEDLGGFKKMIEEVMDFESIDKGEYLIKANFDEKLNKIKNRMQILFARMEALKEKATEDLGLERGQYIRLETVSHIGYHFRITLKDDSLLRKSNKYTIVDVVKGGVRFITNHLKAYSDEFGDLKAQYEEQQKSIVDELIQVAIGYRVPLMSLNREFAQIDCLVSFAVSSQCAPTPYIRPKMFSKGAGVLKLSNLRHPCLELQEHVMYIPSTVDFEKDSCNMFIITGPNMGGKSTYVRSIGVAVLMAHIGAFVPCSEATISMVDSILGRVGASDNIFKGLSTFMVEMIETSSIVRMATENSLVIIDELGRGTSTYEGCGVAWSIAEHLAKNTKCLTLFATHFHEITQLAEVVPTVQNYHMAAVADTKSFVLLFQVRRGPMEKSLGIQIARLANFPQSVIEDANLFYKEFEDRHFEKKTDADEAIIFEIKEKVIQFLKSDTLLKEDDLINMIEAVKSEIQNKDGSAYFQCLIANS